MEIKTVFIDSRWVCDMDPNDCMLKRIKRSFLKLGYHPIFPSEFDDPKKREITFITSDLYYIHDDFDHLHDYRYKMAEESLMPIWTYGQLLEAVVDNIIEVKKEEVKTAFIDIRCLRTHGNDTVEKILGMFRVLDYKPILSDTFQTSLDREKAFMDSCIYYIHDISVNIWVNDYRYQMAGACAKPIWDFHKLEDEFLNTPIMKEDEE